ncbi:hypothetical protein U3516DRAFT_751136 [Neocallimastix sp. 'constans']
MKNFISKNVLLSWLCLCVFIISKVYSQSILGFRPSEVTHGSNIHINNKKNYNIKKFNVSVKEDDSGFFSSIFNSFKKYIINPNEEENENQYRVPLEQPFEVEYQCLNDEKYCNRIKSSFEKVPGYFTRALDIYTPIKLRINIFSFSNSEKRRTSNALAVTTPPPYLVLKDSINGWPFSYPLTLIKQLNTDVKIQYSPGDDDYDIEIDVNTDQMGDYEYFTGMLAHEILHGMGIYYLIQPLSSMLPNFNVTSKIIVPPLNVVETENSEYDNEIEIKSFLPPSVYEKNFVDLEKMVKFNGSLSENYYFFNDDYYRAVKDISLDYNIHQPIQLETEKEQLKQLNDTLYNWEGYQEANDFYQASISSSSIGFLTKEGDIIKLQTYENEYTGDFFHVSTAYECESKEKCTVEEKTDQHKLQYGPNFVMLSKYYLLDLTAEQKIELCSPNNTYGLLGDGLVHILTTLGWTEKGHQPNTKLYYVLMEDELKTLQLEGSANPTSEQLKINNDRLNIAAILPSSSSSNLIFKKFLWIFLSSNSIHKINNIDIKVINKSNNKIFNDKDI